ncbi:MAG: hypothetical protein WEA29_08485 [Acidimicrobiia bacterium]
MTSARHHAPVVESVDRRGFASLRAEWDPLLARSASPSPFLSWPWLSAWVDTIGSDADLQLITARDANTGELVGAAPCFVDHRRRLGVAVSSLRMMGAGIAGGRGLDILVDPTHPTTLASTLWDATTRDPRWDVVDLTALAADGALATLLFRRRADRRDVHGSAASALRTDDAVPAGSPGGESRRLVSRPLDLEETLDIMATLTSGPQAPPLAHPALAVFHRQATHRLLDAGRLRMWRQDGPHGTTAVLYGARFANAIAVHSILTDHPSRPVAPIITDAACAAADEGVTELVLPRGIDARPLPTTPVVDLSVRRPLGSKGRLFGMRGGWRLGRDEAPTDRH